jgi:hypothetical protein
MPPATGIAIQSHFVILLFAKCHFATLLYCHIAILVLKHYRYAISHSHKKVLNDCQSHKGSKTS